MRQPNSHLEADILAAVLHAPSLHVRTLLRMLQSEDFKNDATKAVFIAISNIAKVYGPEGVTYATVGDELRRMGRGDDHDVVNLLDPDLGLGSAGSLEPKCRRLREVRQELFVRDSMLDIAGKEWESPQQLMDAVSEVQQSAIDLNYPLVKSLADVADDLIAQLEYDQQHTDRRVATGLPTLDKYLYGGLAPGWLAVVGARTSVGKTTFAVQVATKAVAAGQRALFFSVEETPAMVLDRAIRFHRRIPHGPDPDLVIRGALEEEVRQLPMVLRSTSFLTEMVAEIADLAENDGVSLVVVDYVGLVRPPTRWESRVQEIAEVTRELKHVAIEYQVPVMLLAQVNRSPMSRNDRHPQLADLRDSGALEQDADVVILLHHDDRNPIEDSLRLAKHRYGPTGEIPVRFNYPIGRIEELALQGGDPHG